MTLTVLNVLIWVMLVPLSLLLQRNSPFHVSQFAIPRLTIRHSTSHNSPFHVSQFAIPRLTIRHSTSHNFSTSVRKFQYINKASIRRVNGRPALSIQTVPQRQSKTVISKSVSVSVFCSPLHHYVPPYALHL